MQLTFPFVAPRDLAVGDNGYPGILEGDGRDLFHSLELNGLSALTATYRYGILVGGEARDAGRKLVFTIEDENGFDEGNPF